LSGITVAIPSKGRLREEIVALMAHAGIRVNTPGATLIDAESDLRILEMRPRDAAEWLRAGRIAAAFTSTDAAMEAGIADCPSIPLGFGASELVLASRIDSGMAQGADLEGKTVATHLPVTTSEWLSSKGITANVVAMGGALEGVCALGLADAIVDLRQTGTSLAINNLQTIEVLAQCEATFAWDADRTAELGWLTTQIQAAVDGRKVQYLMFHMPAEQVGDLGDAFEGLKSPTVVPLAGRTDLVAVHVVVETDKMWSHLPSLSKLGASGLVALSVHAMLP